MRVLNFKFLVSNQGTLKNKQIDIQRYEKALKIEQRALIIGCVAVRSLLLPTWPSDVNDEPHLIPTCE
ncbi:hypothetical protein BDQ12DRAFT_504395 [Crucibulum laeve]|uniref:Uncharacterized protein n=1 Tax=Crucibulum laeve TaxID=68775 RepID=A0A5C3LHM8_9AGAR|nr:hypothetical protein BDQ12DRAFT_504395 [Crucibulum laeve]